MVMEDQIIALYCRIDDAMKDVRPHPQAKLSPSEIVTLAVLSMLTVICDIKRMRHRAWKYSRMHLGWTMAAFNLMLDQAAGQTHEDGRPVFSIAEYVL